MSIFYFNKQGGFLMPYYDPYQVRPDMQQYMQQGQYYPMQNLQVQDYPMQNPQGQGMAAPGLLAAAGNLQQYIYPANLQEALQLIAGAVTGEKEDRELYDYLISTAPSEEDKEIIRGIRDNEIHHFALFRLIYFQLTGQMLPQPLDIPFDKPPTYCAGLRKALLGEESAVVRYRKILFAMQSRVHINMLVEIITDELRHGTLYSYLYAKNGCKA
jgi:rubrerythrin